jgi:hypothetical protein
MEHNASVTIPCQNLSNLCGGHHHLFGHLLNLWMWQGKICGGRVKCITSTDYNKYCFTLAKVGICKAMPCLQFHVNCHMDFAYL